MAVKCIEYTILVYVSGVADADRVWAGRDLDQAQRKLTELRYKFPSAAVRFTEHVHYAPIGPDVPRSAPPSARGVDLERLAKGG